MQYRTRHNILCLLPPFLVYAFIAAWAAWTWTAATGGERGATLTGGTIGLGVVITAAAAFTYWPTRRRPARLYHFTTGAGVEAATIEIHPDATRTLALRGRRRHRPVYFFDRPPSRRAVTFNCKAEPDVFIELVDLDYRGIGVRRRWTGAYHLRGLLHARGRIHPVPWRHHHHHQLPPR